ncbi:MAG: alpha/beta fold hydrolase [Phycisphaerales bacterium]
MSSARDLLLCCCAVLLLCGRATAEDPPRLEPRFDADPGKAWAWTSAGGLRYTWVLPGGDAAIKLGDKRDVIVICHSAGNDYRWAAEHFKPAEFRPRDIVIGVDGTSKGPEDTRLFLARDADVAAFAAFLDEVRKAFPARRVLVYGHGQGGFFALHVAADKPASVDGVAAASGGGWLGSRLTEETRRIPVVILHGTADPGAPYAQSVKLRDGYAALGHPMAALRRRQGWDQRPDPAGASDAIDWCIGMTTSDPAEALSAARAILAPRPADETGRRSPPWFSGGAAILTRFRGQGPAPFALGAGGEAETEAIALLRRVEAEAAGHVEVLRKQVASRDAIRLDGGPWLGHLVAIREDFRGVAPVEAYFKELGYDDIAAKHAEASVELTQTWFRGVPPKQTFETVVRVLPSCFLVEGLPPELGDAIPKFFAQAQGHNLSPESIRRYRFFLMWKAGWDDGLKQYEGLSSKWE